MNRPFSGCIAHLAAAVLFALATAAYYPSQALAQSFCGPVTKVNFAGSLGSNGAYPTGYLTTDGQGNVYGTTNGTQGSVLVPATIWKYSPTNGLTTLWTFNGPTYVNDNIPAVVGSGVTFDSQGNIWSTTAGGGVQFAPASGYGGDGTVYELTSAGAFTTLAEFNGTNGAGPSPLVFDSQGNLWGVTGYGGAAGNGTLFKYSPATQQLTNPVSFSGGSYTTPSGPVVFDSLGNLYGVDAGGSNGLGALWKYSAQGVLTTLFNFTGLNGMGPNGGLLFDGSGNIYGTTSVGGSAYAPPTNGYGTVWKYNLQSGQFTTLVSFTASATSGQQPMAGVALDGSGNLYGTTFYGGTSGDGVVWEYSSAGVLTILANFGGPNGQYPKSTLVFDSLGNLWGTTNQGGAIGYGTLFELTPNTGSGCGPSLSSLTFSPASVPNGGSTTGTVTLSGPAPSGGSVVNLVSGYPYVEMPATVTVPAGSTSATFTAAPEDFVNSDYTIYNTASLGSSIVQGSLTQTPGVAVSAISVRPSSVAAGASTTATVTLTAAAPAGGNQVFVETCSGGGCNANDPNPPVQLPVTVTVPAGKTSLSFSIGTLCTNTSEVPPIYAQSGGATVSTSLTVKPSSSCTPTLSSVGVNPPSVTGGDPSTGQVILTANAPTGGAVVTLSSSSGSASVPSSVTVVAGSSNASFSVTTASVTTTTTAVITGTYNSSSAQTSLSISPASSVQVSQLILNPIDVTGGNTSTGTVYLTAEAPPGGAVVTLSSSSGSASVPSSVTVAAGNTIASFTITTTSVTTSTTAVITATYNSSSAQASLTILPGSSGTTLSSLTLNPTSVSGGNNSTGTVTLSSAAPSGGAVVSLSSSNTSVATVPSSVTVAAGQTSASFTVSTQRVSSNTNVTISGTYAGATQSATLTVTGRHH